MAAIQTLLRLWLKFSDATQFENAMLDPLGAQRRKLLEIVRANRETVYGREHDFESIREIADFQARVPRNTYETLTPYIERAMAGESGILTAEQPRFFATTSGTTGRTKYIPVTDRALKEYSHGIHVHLYRLLSDYPDILEGSALVSSSSDEEGVTEGGIPFGAISGYLAKRQPSFVRRFYALPYEICQIKDIEAKYYLMLRHAIGADIRLIMTPNPSSLILLAEKMSLHAEDLLADLRAGGVNDRFLPEGSAPSLSDLKPDPARADELGAILQESGRLRPAEVWRNLRLISCWKGGTMPLYLRRLPEFYGDVPVRDLGYMASEGRGGTPLVNSGSGGVLAVTSHFFEFLPVDDRDDPDAKLLTCDGLKPNNEYFIFFTTSGGLYRYDINDVVRVIDFHRNTPVIQFVRKGSGMTSITGEKLTESQVTAAMLDAVEEVGADVRHFTVCPEWAELPFYAVYAEFGADPPVETSRELLDAFDRSLQKGNMEYESKRSSQRLGAPSLKRVPIGTYDDLRQQRVLEGAPEAQVKIPNLSPDMKFGEKLPVSEIVRSGHSEAAS